MAENRGQRTEVRSQRTDNSGTQTENRQQTLGLEPCAVRLPIIAMTAHAMAGDREKSLAIGMDDHVAKPIDPNELFTILEKWIPPAEKPETG